jgi:hypothetical protein
MEQIVDSRTMSEHPTQEEIDAVAYFVEAVRELRSSPFFIEEYTNLAHSISTDDPKGHGQFQDTNIVKAVIVPFRRVWQQNEPCQYRKIMNILKKHVPKFQGFLDFILPDDNGSIGSIIKAMPCFQNIDLSLTDVINIWLNTRYLHIGKSVRKGKFTRKDFERFNSQIGPVLFEFYFLTSIHEMGICFLNILQCAESFLHGLAQQGLVPSFPFQANTVAGNVERRTPGFTPEPDSPEQRVWRLRRRNHYSGISKFLNLVGCSDQLVATLIRECSSFDDFVLRLNVHLEHASDLTALSHEDIIHREGCGDNYRTVIKNGKSRRGFVITRRNGTLVWGGDYIPILRDQYVEFREAMMAEHFK